MTLFLIGKIMNINNIFVLGAGFACADIIKYNGNEEMSLGGTAANVLSILGQLGTRVAFLNVNYNEEMGAWLRDALLRRGVRTIYFANSKMPVPRVIELLDSNGHHSFQTVCPICGKRLVKTILPSISHVKKTIFNENVNLNLFFYDRISEGIKAIAAFNNKGWNFYEPNSFRVYETFRDAAKSSNIIKFSLERISKSYVKLLHDDLQASMVQLIIVSDGQNGFYYSYRDKTGKLCKWIYVTALVSEKTVDDSGAGDWLTATFLYEFLKEYPYYTDQLEGEKLERMLNIARKVSSFNCGFLGAQGIFKNKDALSKLNNWLGSDIHVIKDKPCNSVFTCQYCKSV